MDNYSYLIWLTAVADNKSGEILNVDMARLIWFSLVCISELKCFCKTHLKSQIEMENFEFDI